LKANVSVIIPYFNARNTIERALVSIDLQSLRPAEVILINDASDYEHTLILSELSAKYGGWLKIINQLKNAGAATARNEGWNLATQTYIAFLDADDAWHPKKIEIQYAYMENNSDVMLCGHLCRELSTECDLNWLIGDEHSKEVTWGCLLLKNHFVTPSVMLRRSITLRFSNGKRYIDDHLLWLNIVHANMKAVKLGVELAAVFKPMYGASGLSADMWLMERAEILNYNILFKEKKISFPQMILLQCFSFIKYFRRLSIVYLVRKLSKS